MENASKALIMAGSILMALMVIGALVFMYQNLSDVKQAEIDAEDNSQITEYGQKFEQYNKKSVYGSELMSLANLQADYNKSQAEEKGYSKINISVTIKNPIALDTYFTNISSIGDVTIAKNAIENDIDKYETKNTYKGKPVKYYSQISNREIAQIYGIEFSSYTIDYDIGEALKNDSRTKKLMEDIENYKNIKTTYTEFKNKKFKCTDVKYDINGRISQMTFVEQ